MAELSWRTPSAAIVTVAVFGVTDRLYMGHTIDNPRNPLIVYGHTYIGCIKKR